jgi:hypothetical protein
MMSGDLERFISTEYQEKCIWGHITKRSVCGMNIKLESNMWDQMPVTDVCVARWPKKVPIGPDD